MIKAGKFLASQINFDCKRCIISMPWWAAKFNARIIGLLPNPLITADQVTFLKSDNVVSDAATSEARTLQGMGLTPQGADAILPAYLWRYRVAGQYTKMREAH